MEAWKIRTEMAGKPDEMKWDTATWLQNIQSAQILTFDASINLLLIEIVVAAD